MTPPRILIFDSGLGGLTVYQAVAALRPDAELTYVADDAFFPYGALSETALVARVVALMGELIERFHPDLVVVACNTASTLVLGPLRQAFATPFVGTVPAIKPAALASRSKSISVLATPGTVARDYTRALIHEFASDCDVTLVGAPRLAGLAEAALRGEAIADADIAQEIAPAFVERAGRRTGAIGGPRAVERRMGRPGPRHRPPRRCAARSGDRRGGLQAALGVLHQRRPGTACALNGLARTRADR
jgi:glutamate racemase